MSNYLDQIQIAIEEEAKLWAEAFIQSRKQFLASKKVNVTGELQDSLATETLRQVKANIVETLIEFESHGRMIDMKRLNTAKGGDLLIKALEAWLIKRGFFQKNRAKYEQKYEAGRKFQRLTTAKTRDARALNRMAWGIAIVRASGKYRRRRWYNKPKTAAISELFNRVAANLPTVVSDEIKKQF